MFGVLRVGRGVNEEGSNTTRIETLLPVLSLLGVRRVNERVPTQQGLKHLAEQRGRCVTRLTRGFQHNKD